jgi:chemosensory pili system protein ChpC
MATALALRTQLIPLHGARLILPNTAIAEIVPYSEPEPLEDAPAFLLGRMSWRGQEIPLISFEAVCGKDAPALNPRARLAVLNTLNGNAALPFFAVLTQGIPQLLQVSEANLQPIGHETLLSPMTLCQVLVNGEPAVIPDLDALESELLRAIP